MLRFSAPALAAALLGCYLWPAAAALGSSIHVPGDAPTIQAGLGMAHLGDSVIVAPGTYYENLDMPTGVVLTGAQGATATTVDGGTHGPVITCNQVFNFEIRDLTLRNGRNTQFPGGAGISMLESWGAAVVDCHLIDNHAVGRDGGGIAIARSGATVRGCLFQDNGASGSLDGGGVFVWEGLLLLDGCILVGNQADEGGGIAITSASTVTVHGCLVLDNEAISLQCAGGGLIAVRSQVVIEHNTFVGNRTWLDGGSVAFAISGDVTFRNNIIAHAAIGYGLVCEISVDEGCNDVWDSARVDYAGCGPAPDDLSVDPEFCHPPGQDYTLSQSSPCAPDHSPAGCGLIGAFDVGCGPVAIESSTWGLIKAGFAGGGND